MKKTLYLILVSLFFTAQAYASSITSTSGTWADGNSITIVGTGFGTKSTAAPLSWLKANIEAGTDTNDFAATDWVNNGSCGSPSPSTTSVYTTDQAHSGTKSILFDFTTAAWCQNRYDSGSDGGLSPIYFTAWIYFDKIDSVDGVQWKSWRFSSSSGYAINDEATTALILHDWWVHDTDAWYNSNIRAYYDGGSSNDNIGYLPSDGVIMDAWQRLEVYATMGASGAGTYVINRIGKGSLVSDAALTTNDGDDGAWRYIRIGQMYNKDAEANDQAKIYYDDIYVDNSPARVEICDTETWENRTHCEIQAPSSWNANGQEIVFTVNNGSIANPANGSYYLFVVDGTNTPSDQDPYIDEENPGSAGAQGYLIGEAATDTTDPATSAWSPAKDATGVSINADITFTIADAGAGVDSSTIEVDVEGTTYCLAEGSCDNKTLSKVGTPASYNITYTHSAWSYDQEINVSIDADDLADTPNSMTTDTYSFTCGSDPGSSGGGGSTGGGSGGVTGGGSGGVTGG